MLELVGPGILLSIPFRMSIIQRSHNATTQNLQVIKKKKDQGYEGPEQEWEAEGEGWEKTSSAQMTPASSCSFVSGPVTRSLKGHEQRMSTLLQYSWEESELEL